VRTGVALERVVAWAALLEVQDAVLEHLDALAKGRILARHSGGGVARLGRGCDRCIGLVRTGRERERDREHDTMRVTSGR
jgi:hypothetical protein